MVSKKEKQRREAEKELMNSVDLSFKRSRELRERLKPDEGMMRYYLDYAKSFLSYSERMRLTWDLFKNNDLTQERAQEILDIQQDYMARGINDLIGYMRVDRSMFATHNYDKIENYREGMRLDRFTNLYYSENFVFEVALTLEELQNDEGVIANTIQDLRLTANLQCDTINWKPKFVFEDHVVLEVEISNYQADDELIERMEKFRK